MADRSLRGMRLGAQSLQSEEGVEFSPRQMAVYRCEDGTTFEVMFSAEAEVPEIWASPKNGQEGKLLDAEGQVIESDQPAPKEARTHWDMLLERRTRAELEDLLQERLDYLRSRRGEQKIGA
ncbi:RNA polymerase-binding protein RbpA [Compostimonas suwonensis]|uniref:RNA polymerase-binding protein RbpA n=1 Tax=Compostimonas suwonensis TaxID=1048394 RepID=A0A2M9BYV1_9MICO|nr:RNA polymerase-binding protein RbpA [Compostimonas suwonensis]PJJ63255.1 RNA polymerase binding protein RbpA [Compostimonas suwonensis]